MRKCIPESRALHPACLLPHPEEFSARAGIQSIPADLPGRGVRGKARGQMAGRRSACLSSPFSDKFLAPRLGGFMSQKRFCCKKGSEDRMFRYNL